MRFATNERASTTLALIAETLAAAGGVPAKVLADRMACLKGGFVTNVVVPTPDYVRLAPITGSPPTSVTPATRSPRHRGEPVRLRPGRPGGAVVDRGRRHRNSGHAA